MEESERPGAEDRRPTPVRMAMEGTEAGAAEDTSEFRTLADPGGGSDWVVRVSGRSSSGILPLRVISLLELSFARVDEPESPLRRAICQGTSLDEFKDEELLRALADSRPFEPVQTKDDPRTGKGPRGRGRQGPRA